MIKNFLIAAGLIIAGFSLGFGVATTQEAPTRLEKTRELAHRIQDDNPDITVNFYLDPVAGPTIAMSLPPLAGDDMPRTIGRVELGYDGEILPSFYDFETRYTQYHWNKSMTYEQLQTKILWTRAEYAKRTP